MTGRQNKLWLVGILLLTIAATLISFSEGIGSRIKGPVGKAFSGLKTYYGLDIKGGVRVTLTPDIKEYEKTGRKWNSSNLESVRHVIDKRVNFTGVSEPLILTKPDSNQIIVELPGLKDEKEALARLQSTASLKFYLLPQLGSKEKDSGIWAIRRDEKGDEYLVDSASGQALTPAELEEHIFSKPPIASGDDLLPDSCKADVGQGGSAYINFAFDPLKDGSRKFEEHTRAFVGSYLAIFLDKKLLTAPTINGPISGNGIIEGNFTLESAKALSDQLNAGALPVPLTVEEVRKLEATLGKEAVTATTYAGAIGLALVLIFMIGYYRLPGVLASVALILYAFFSFALFKLIPVTLTLPGIAGFILSIGMAVDANILIFERLKEELRSGKTLRNSIDTGFKRAFTAIFDSNVCTLITCTVLYMFGTGPIKGFALTLGVGVLVSMFTAITVTRTFLFALVGAEWAQKGAAYGLALKFVPDLKVMKRWQMWLGISGVIIIPGIIASLTGGIKQSIDFTGGTELQIPFAQRRSADQILASLAKVNPKYKDSRVVVEGASGGRQGSAVFVTTPKLTDEERVALLNAVTENGAALAPGFSVVSIPYSNVSGSISNELKYQAVMAVVVASLLIVLYLAFRFAIGGFREGLKYGLCAVAALLHDVLIVWGAFAIMGHLLHWQIDSLFVTAMLTVIGFSVHDTIIVFDRIRENLQHRQKGQNFSDLTDQSIDQTIARSINTSLTVVLTLLALFFFGGSVIHQFTGALLIGIISGTYSSIFNASVLLVLWKKRDTGLVMDSSGSASGPKTGISSRSGKTLPGDKPLVAPPKEKPAPAVSTSPPRTYEKKETAQSSDEESGSDSEAADRSRQQRLSARRKRRM